MIRTQLYLTESEKSALSSIAVRSGKKQSELIREAIDSFVAKFQTENQSDICDRVSGIWADRDESFDAADLRETWDRDGY